MTKVEIRKSIEDKIKKLGVRGAYKFDVVGNAKAIKSQFDPLKTEKDKAVVVNLAHALTVNGFKEAGILNRFSSLFAEENVIYDEVWDYCFEDLLKVVDKE